ncbi:MAG: hypothetical protein ACK55I_15800, partial [bacterium]
GQRDQFLRTMRDEARVYRLFLDQLLENVLRDFVVRDAVRDIQAEFDRAVATAGNIAGEPSGLGFLDQIPVARPAPRALQVDHAGDISLGILVLDFQSAAHALGHATDQL